MQEFNLPTWENSPETPITAEDLNAYTEAIKELQNRDYVVEEGTDGNWSWEKWSNGKAVIRRTYGFKADSTGTKTVVIPYPFPFVGNTPNAFFSDFSNSTIFSRLRYGDAGGNNENALNELVLTFEEVTSTTFNCYASILVIGKWK